MTREFRWRLGAVGRYLHEFLQVFFYLNFFVLTLLVAQDVGRVGRFLRDPATVLGGEVMCLYLCSVLTLTATLQGIRGLGNKRGRIERAADFLLQEERTP